MKRNFKKLIGKIHLWLGLTSGLVVFILGITGCIWAFEEEIRPWIYSDKLFVHPPTEQNQHRALSKNLDAAQQVLLPGYRIQRMTIHNDPERTQLFRHYTRDTVNRGVWYWSEAEYRQSVYINPYSSEVVAAENPEFAFFNVVLWMHWSLLLKNEIGQPIVGMATIIFVIMLITGLVLWWPKNTIARKQRIWFRWKPTTKWKRKNYDLHNILGFYSMFLVIFIALTGLMWAFTWFNDGVKWIADGGGTVENTHVKIESTVTASSAVVPLDIVYNSLKTDHAEAEVYYINLPQDSTGTVGAYIEYEDRTKTVYQQYDQYSGKLLHTGGRWEEKTNGEKLSALNYDIHVGAIGGLVGKTIAFFLSLFAASLPVTGFMIWYGRKFKKRKRKSIGRKKTTTLNPSRIS